VITTLVLLAVWLLPVTASAAPKSDHKPGDQARPRTIAVLGSSVAAGWVTSRESRYDLQNGYAYRLQRLLEPRGWNVVNVSTPGDTTSKVLARMERDLRRVRPGYVLIGLAMTNEGLETEPPDKVLQGYTAGLRKIIDTCRESGMVPVVGLCYANDNFDRTHYDAIKRMNGLINTWDVPGINLLGPLDNGHGRFIEGYTFDLDHPDDVGHAEMFYAVVPSLFDALAVNKPLPTFAPTEGHTTVDATETGPPISYVPNDVMHSFAMAFDVRTSAPGRIATIYGADDAINIDVDNTGRFRFESPGASAIVSAQKCADGAWHRLTVSHHYLLGRTEYFLDGRWISARKQQLAPTQFVLGGDRTGRGATPADYRRLLIYRAPLNDDEVKALEDGASLQASLEVFAPLNGERLVPDTALTNTAQSTARVHAYPTDATTAVAELTQKIAGAANDKRFIDPDEPKPVDVDPAILKSYVGIYRAEPGLDIIISYEDGRLLFSPNGQGKTPLYPKSDTAFFMKVYIPNAPNTRLGMTFIKEKNGSVNQAAFHQGHIDMLAKRVK